MSIARARELNLQETSVVSFSVSSPSKPPPASAASKARLPLGAKPDVALPAENDCYCFERSMYGENNCKAHPSFTCSPTFCHLESVCTHIISNGNCRLSQYYCTGVFFIIFFLPPSVENKQYMAFSLSDKTIRVYQNTYAAMTRVNTVICIRCSAYPASAHFHFVYCWPCKLKGHRDKIQNIRFLHSGDHLLLSASRFVEREAT